MRNRFDEQLDLLNNSLISMGALCETAIAGTIKALLCHDLRLAEEVIATDKEIDQKEKEIEALCLKLILHQQPVARDLRQISAALKMIADMERIGDQAADIADIVPHLPTPPDGRCGPIREMAHAVIRMVTESVDAYVRRDTALAEAVIRQDDEVDDYFDRVRHALTALIAQDPGEGERALDLLMIAKYFERIGDHSTNIAEWVVFAVTGVHNGVEEL